MTTRQNNAPKFRVRPIEPRDIFAITEIYALYVETSYATFETIAPDVEEMSERIKKLNAQGYPTLVAVASEGEDEGEDGNEDGGGGDALADGAQADGAQNGAQADGAAQREEVMGYAYAAPYKARNAYRYTAEDSVYVKKSCLKRGVGKALLEALILEASRRGFWQLLATISKRAGESSIKLHETLGFRIIGTAVGIGFKFEQLVDVVYMQKKLNTSNDG